MSPIKILQCSRFVKKRVTIIKGTAQPTLTAESVSDPSQTKFDSKPGHLRSVLGEEECRTFVYIQAFLV